MARARNAPSRVGEYEPVQPHPGFNFETIYVHGSEVAYF